MKHLIVLCLIVLCIASPAWAADNDPAKLSDINRMLRAGKDVEAVLVELDKRGLGFRLSSTSEKRLKEWGFNDEQLRQVHRISRGLKIERGDNAPKQEDKDKDHAPGLLVIDGLPTAFPVGYAIGDEVRDSEARVMSRAVAATKINYKAYTFERFILVCSPRRGEELSKKLKELETKLTQQLPKSLANATEAKTALLVLADNNRDAVKMLQAITRSYKAEFPDYDTTLDNRRWSYYMGSHFCIVDGAEFKTADAAMRPLSFGIGQMMAAHIAFYKEPDVLAMGLGNLIETIAAGSPSITLFSDSGDDEPEIKDWAGDFKQRQAAKKLPSTRMLFDYEVERMKPKQYVEAWALVSWLAKEPDKLFATLHLCRDPDAIKHDLVLKTYGITEERFKAQWPTTIGN